MCNDSSVPKMMQGRYGLAEEYARFWSPVIKPMGLRLLETLPLGSARRVVDIGCGTGNLISEIVASAPNARYLGLDRAGRMLEVAAKSCVPLVHADGCRLPLRNSSFDLAVMAFVVFKLPSPLEGLIEAKRVLRPGGTLGVTVWNGDSHVLPGDEIWVEALADIPADPDESSRLEDLNEIEKLRALLESAGFTGIDIQSEAFERTWTPESIFALKSGLSHHVRLVQLPFDERERRLAEVRARLSEMEPSSFIWRPSILFAMSRNGPPDD
ncbi:MAG: class I SAM-dependent methyltransferase [Fimbriimonadales bacterium]